MVDAKDIQAYLEVGHETRSFEVKGPGAITDKNYLAKVARAAMAMGNLRDGGLVCLGIDDNQLKRMTPGLEGDLLKQWGNFDRVSAALARFSDPPVTFELYKLKLSNGVKVTVLEIAEFEHVPHVCKRDSPAEATQAGVIYVRARRQPESVPIPTADAMRELVDLATDKGVRDFVRRATTSGLTLGAAPPPTAEERDAVAFAAEVLRAWDSEDTFAGNPDGTAYLDSAIRPAPYDPARVETADLEQFVLTHAVRLRGSSLPMMSPQDLRRYDTWLAMDASSRSGMRFDAWRLFTSGHFLHRRSLMTDVASSNPELQPTNSAATGAVAVWDVLFHAVELVELAARFATTLACDQVSISISMENIAGRQLIAGQWTRMFDDHHLYAGSSMNAQVTLSSAELLADPRGQAVTLAQALFIKFGVRTPDQVLYDWQAKDLR